MCGKQYILLVLVISAVLSESRRPNCRRMGGKCRRSCSGDNVPLPDGKCCGKKVCCIETCSNVNTKCEEPATERICVSKKEDCKPSDDALDTTTTEFKCCSSTLFPYCCSPTQ